MKMSDLRESSFPSVRYNVDGYSTSVSFTEHDLVHCSNCIDAVEYLLNPNTDGESFCVSSDDIEYLARLLYRSYNIMSEVVEASGGSYNAI